MTYVYLLSAAGLTCAALLLFKFLPSKWLCDYGEQPSDIHKRENRKLSPVTITLLSAFCAAGAYLFIRTEQRALIVVSFCVCAALLVLIAVCDYKYGIIPNELLCACAVLGLPLMFKNGWQQPVIGFLIGGAGLFIIIFIASKLLKAEAMGMGDVFLSALCGLLCGGAGYAAVFFTAIISAGIFFAILLTLKRIDKKSSQPFGPFLVLGAFSALCLQIEWQSIFNWYINGF